MLPVLFYQQQRGVIKKMRIVFPKEVHKLYAACGRGKIFYSEATYHGDRTMAASCLKKTKRVKGLNPARFE
jgi:hypothetical protein